jgi:hypothetical protein
MSTNRTRGRLALVAMLATAAIGSAAGPAQAQDPSPANCEAKLERLVEKFYRVEEKRGYEYATKWWEPRWERYHEHCVLP